ncbi:MAG: hypothetical protein COA45_03205 [Zetaproteobacteria bacterium]|nr:MAG: hypothetical protein COA45_03205 [Zetaproteobacteria bacterium]
MKNNNKKLANNKELSARILAVQAYYEVLHNEKPLRSVIEESLERGLQVDDDDSLAQPHGGLFKKILTSLDARLVDINEILAANIHKKEVVAPVLVADSSKDDVESEEGDAVAPESAPAPKKELEPLLKSILLCGVCELLEHQDIDAPIIINDYLNVTHFFYEQQQVNFVNGILAKIASGLRE